MSNSKSRIKKLRVLVVDDDQDGADLIASLLTLSGHDALAAYGGVEAINLGSTFEPNVVFLDISMPVMNGWEVARKIRSQPWGASVVLVAMTGWVDPQMNTLSEQLGFSAHLVKPVGHEELVKTLADISRKQA